MSERLRHVDVRRVVPRAVVAGLIGFALLYIVVIADPPPEIGGNWRTTSSGSAIDDWQNFVITLLNSLTFAGWLFIVASGFSLIFGLMRVVNMAHGSFYLLGGYIAYEIHQSMTGRDTPTGGLGGGGHTGDGVGVRGHRHRLQRRAPVHARARRRRRRDALPVALPDEDRNGHSCGRR